MDNKVTQILGSSNAKIGVNTDNYINVQLNGSERLLPPNELNKVLNLSEQFNKERQECKIYRIIGTINTLATNVLFNTTGTEFCWEIFNQPKFKDITQNIETTTLTFSESIRQHLKEIDGWYGYYNPIKTDSGLCAFFDMEPKRERFSFIPDITNQLVKNWELTITYPYTSDTTNYLINGGLLIVDKEPVLIGGKNMTGLALPVLHNLIDGDTILLTGTNLDGQYEVKRVGLDNGSNKEYYFCIDVDYDTLQIGQNSRMLKIYNGVTSQYYFRKFKRVKTVSSSEVEKDDYEIYKLPFSKNIYGDDVTQFTFNEDIDVSNLTDNLGRPLSQLYLTTIKTNSNNIFGLISSGIEAPLVPQLNNGNKLPYLKNIPIIQKIHNAIASSAQTYAPLELSVNINNKDFYGDIVEYNTTTVQEIVLGDVYHRFNTINREITSNSIVSGPRPEGYYYKAHHLIQIRNFSSYIEEGNESTEGKPSYSVNLGDGRYLWRDLLDIGTTDINENYVTYPFLNGTHYLYQNYYFDIKRQDPFDNWDMYYSAFPADPIGNTMNNNFKVNVTNNVC